MHLSGTSGWRWVQTIWVAAVGAIGFLSPTVYGQKDMGAGFCAKHGNYTGASCPQCAARAGAGSGGSAQNQIILEAAGQVGTTIGSAIHKKIFGDPAEKARLAAEAQSRNLEAQRAAERAVIVAERQRQEAFDRLSGTLKLDSFDGDKGGGLMLKGVEVGSNGSGGFTLKPEGSGNQLALKLGEEDLKPQGIVAVANTNPVNQALPNTDPMVVDLRKAPSGLARDSGGKLALKLGADDVQPQGTTVTSTAPANEFATALVPAQAPEPARAAESASDPAPVPATALNTESVAENPAARKTIDILDRAVSATLENLKSSQSGESIDIDRELSEIKAVLNIPPSGKKGDDVVRTISFGHQISAKSGEKQNAGQILVVRNEETGEVHIDVTQAQTGKAATQRIIHIDRFGNIIAQESR